MEDTMEMEEMWGVDPNNATITAQEFARKIQPHIAWLTNKLTRNILEDQDQTMVDYIISSLGIVMSIGLIGLSYMV